MSPIRFPAAAVAVSLMGSGATARAQGLPGDLAPERAVRLPQPLPEADEEDTMAASQARPYRDGQLVPPGHDVVTTYHGPLLATGVALFGFHWVFSLVLAQADFRLGTEGIERDEARNNALMAPLIGPFIALGAESGRPASERALFVFDGLAQAGTLAMAMSGLIVKRKWLVPVEVGVSPGGARLEVRF